MALRHNTGVVNDGLVFAVDAANPKSYPGTGTTWYDLCGNYDFTLSNAAAYNSNGNASFMNLKDYGCKYIPGSVLTDVAHYNTATICIMANVKAPDGDWKTLCRSSVADHHVIVSSSDGISLGMYDNDSAGFIDTGFDINTLPSYQTQFNYMAWRFSSNSSPYYEFFYNENTASAVASSTNSNAAFNRGFATIGGYHNGNNSPTSFSQEFGHIGVFLYYNRHLTTAELNRNYVALRARYN